MRRCTLTALVAILCVSCGGGPSRHPAPQVADIGRGPQESPPPVVTPAPPPPTVVTPMPPPSSPPPVVTDRPPVSEPPPVTTPPRPAIPTPPPPVTTAPRVTPVRPLGPYAFLDGFVAEVVRKTKTEPPPALVVLPAFTLNPHFQRYEVTRLGDDLAREISLRIESTAAGSVLLVSPEQFRRELRAANRSLADLDGPQAVVSLAARTGTRYAIRGLVADTQADLTVDYECVDVLNASVVAHVRQTFTARDSAGVALFRKHRNNTGQPLLSNYRIGVLAPAATPNLQAELQWTVAQAVRRLLEESGANLQGKRAAVPPTVLPEALRFTKYQQAFRRQIQREKEHFIAAGWSDAEAMSKGPVKILGKRFDSLRDAERYAATVEVEKALSSSGELGTTVSRIIFDHLENQGGGIGVDVIPHDDLIATTVTFSREEMEKIKDGILDAKTKEYFQTKGAQAILLSELLESGDSYELVFRIRSLKDLKPLTSQVRFYLEPRFAYDLRGFLKG